MLEARQPHLAELSTLRPTAQGPTARGHAPPCQEPCQQRVPTRLRKLGRRGPGCQSPGSGRGRAGVRWRAAHGPRRSPGHGGLPPPAAPRAGPAACLPSVRPRPPCRRTRARAHLPAAAPPRTARGGRRGKRPALLGATRRRGAISPPAPRRPPPRAAWADKSPASPRGRRLRGCRLILGPPFAWGPSPFLPRRAVPAAHCSSSTGRERQAQPQ
jgi:hypothetical protein